MRRTSFRDPAGNPIPLDYTSESGAVYPAPEPAGLALATLGAAALAVASARRRRA